jgi:hypothetical protein
MAVLVKNKKRARTVLLLGVVSFLCSDTHSDQKIPS